jgi:DsbC/DsbD-like thiol-disulfide interchange protein
MTRFSAPLLAAALAALALSPARADSHSGLKADFEILPGWRAEDGTHMAALRIVLAPGWKTYWRAPGEAGLPPTFDWSGSENLAELHLLWPVPEVFTSNGMTTLGYHDELVLPLEIVPLDPAAEVRLDGALAMGICHDICMPMQTSVSAVLPRSGAGPDAQIVLALDRRPDTALEAGVISARCSVEPISDGLRVTARIDMPAIGAQEMTVIETPNAEIWVSEAITRRAENMLTATADLVPPEARPFDLDPDTLRLTVLSGDRAVDIAGCTRSR